MSVQASTQALASASPSRARATAVAWMPHAELTVDEWQRFGPKIGLMSKSTNWWLGDWVRIGQRRYDMRYQRASELTGYDEQTLMNLAYVAGRYEISRRRENLSWSHHAELAKFDSREQEFWLDRTVERNLSVRQLRTHLRDSAKHKQADDIPDIRVTNDLGPDKSRLLLCSHCGQPLPTSY